MKRITFPRAAKDRGPDAKVKPQSPVGELLCNAIQKWQRIEFMYDKELRVAEPQCFGIGTRGKVQLRVYQINKNPRPEERLMDVGKIKDLKLLDSHFTEPGPNYSSTDSAFIKIICKLR
jgi:hypothetical protein